MKNTNNHNKGKTQQEKILAGCYDDVRFNSEAVGDSQETPLNPPDPPTPADLQHNGHQDQEELKSISLRTVY